MLIKFLQYLKLRGVSSASLKYYKSDITNFINWAGEREITAKLIREYIKAQTFTSPRTTINRRLSTLRSYSQFLGRNFMLGVNNVTDVKSVQAPEIKVPKTSAYKFLQEKILARFERKPRVQNAFFKLFFARPNWYKAYHSYPLASYIHIAILVLFTSLSGYALYDQVFKNPANPLAFPTALTRPNRYLSFQGRLTDNLGNPKTVATDMVFKLYAASSGGSALWDSGTCSITPDQDGIFSTLLGSSCGAEIASTVFSENASIWLGATIGADAEATPRVQIATVAYALNSETLQGYPAGTGTSTIPYINSTGALVLANASPTIQSTSGTFAVEGLAMTLTTPNASDGIITINPDGVGTLNLTFEGTAAGVSANGFVNATNANITSGALYGGTVASAATGYNFIDFQSGVSPASKFSVSAVGDVTLAGDLTVSGSSATLPNNSISPNEIFTTGQTDEYCLTYEATGTTWEWQSCAAAGGGSWSALTVPTDNLSLAHAGYTTAFTFDSLTTADAFALSSSSLTTGTILDLSSTSTAGGASGLSKVLDITRSGTNANASHTAYGLYSAVTNTGTTSTNVGGYFSASGATNNYGLIVENGYVGIGTATPTYRLDVRGASTGIGFDVSGAYPVIIPTLNATTEDIKLSSLGNGGNLYLSAPGTDATDSYIDFATAGSSKMRISNDGNITITEDLTITGDDLFMATNTANYFLMADGTNYNPTSPADARTGLGLTAGGTGDIWVEKAGDTMTGALTNTLATGNSLVWDTNTLIVDASNDRVGIGTTGPDAKLDSLATTEQLRLTYTDGTVYSSFTTDSNGYIAIDPTGGRISLDGSLQIGGTTPLAYSRFGTATTGHGFTGSDDVLIGGDLEVNGVLYLDGRIIANPDGTATIIFADDASAIDSPNILDNGVWWINNTVNDGMASLMVNNDKAGDLFTASASGTPKFTIANTGAITSAIGNWTSQVADSATAVGFTFNTSNTLSTQGSKLLSFQNLGTEKMYLDKDGNLYVSGTVLSGNGVSMLLTNKSGGIVASKAIVVLDTSNNTSFTTTTTPYSKSGFGVVVGVGLGVTNDADGDGVCDADDICMVAYAGSVNVTVKNATTAVKGDYLFTSDTAGSAVASAKQYDGLVGIVDDTTNSASGYLRMIFKVQPQVTAAAAIDKGTKHNEYWLYADQYQAVGEGSNTDTNLLQRGLAFDTFTDSTKTDSANTTVSYTPEGRVGLIGGQTLATSTTDNDGQTYLGSNTVNDTYYYDRTRDSATQVQVELGIDPNWYNGVTLSVATTSAQFSQNSTITQPNPNLSTSYNGSLIKATGTDSTPRTIYITIKSPTTFDWTNYNGQAATGVTMTPGTAQALGTTGVSATFTNARYNTGDVFKIASWFIEAESATRGAKQQFPERSNVIATDAGLDIIDADTQKLWMRFTEGGTGIANANIFLPTSGGENLSSSSTTSLNGTVYVGTKGTTQGRFLRILFSTDDSYWNRASGSSNDYSGYNSGIANRNDGVGYSVVNTSLSLVNEVVNDVSAAVIPNQPTQTVTVSGWGYIIGSGLTYIREGVNLPYKFNSPPTVVVGSLSYLATSSGAPTSIGSCTGIFGGNSTSPTVSNITNSTFYFNEAGSDVFSSSYNYCYTWTATGQVSPKQFVAVATAGGISAINETDQTVMNFTVASNVSKVFLLNNGNLYTVVESASSYLGAYYQSIFRSGSEITSATRDYYYRQDTTPSTWISAKSAGQITSLFATKGTSIIDGKSNTIYVGTTEGLTVLQEKQSGATAGDGSLEASGSVKYYTKDYISEEMVGDIRGMWPLSANGALSMSDASVKADTLTNNGTATAVTGVRGAGVSLNGTTQYLSCTDAACGGSTKLDPGGTALTFGAWVKAPTCVAAQDMFMSKANSGPGGFAYYLSCTNSGGVTYTSVMNTSNVGVSLGGTSNISDNKWHYVVTTYDGAQIRLYVDGKLESSIAQTGNVNDGNSYFAIGAGYYNGVWGNYFAGTIDEPFVTATALTAGQIKNMYQVGYRALQSHATTLGGGAADTNQQLGGTTNTIGAAQPDLNNQFMYVGSNSTTLGAVSKIDLNSDTNIKTYNSSANVPTGGPLLIDEDTKSLAVGYNLEAVGSATTGVKTMGVDNNATATSGNFIGKTVTTAESFTQAYLWAQYTLDASDTSNTIQVWASNDGGSNYSQCNLTNTDTSRSPSEYEYFCQFNTPGSSLKTKFVMARGSTKTNTYVTKYGISWIDSNAIAGSALGSGLYTTSGTSVASGSYIDVAHNQNSNDVVTNGWVYNTTTSKWEQIGENNNTDATGGTITYNGGYTIHTFTSSGTFTPNSAGNVEYLVVGGGGGGGDDGGGGGGGGGGGYQTGTLDITAQTYPITVGAGGRGSRVIAAGATAGDNSVFSTITANGGGAGGDGFGVSRNGGSGGGGGYSGQTGGTGSQGSNGGNSVGSGAYPAGGGGGAGAVGANGSGSQSGVGGAGTASSISGASVTYAGGGGGGGATAFGASPAAGGVGGGGDGSNGSGAAGTANTGGGGGGGGNNANTGGNGGSGIVIVRYLTNSLSAFKITQVDANTVRLYNYSGSAQNLRLDVITGGLGRNAGTVSLAPAAADVDSQTSTNSIWINKTGSGGSLLKLQQSGTDVLNLSSTALTLTGNFLPGTDNTYSLGATSSARFKDLYLGPASLHIQSKSTDSGYPTLGLDYALGINTAGSLVTSLNGTSNALMTITQGGNVGIGTTAPVASLQVGTNTYGTGPKVIIGGTTGSPATSGTAQTANFRITSNNGTALDFGSYTASPYAQWIQGVDAANLAGTYPIVLQPNGGNVGIGTTNPAGRLDVFTDANQAGITTKSTYSDYATIMSFLAAGGSQKGSITGTPTSVAYNTTSDLRLKENIIDTSLGLDALKQISIKDFNFISDPEKMKTQGFIAQELYKIYPYAVTVGGDDPNKNPWGVDYGRLTPLIIKSIQELNAKVNSIASQIQNAVFPEVKTSLISPIANTDLIIDLQPDNSEVATQLIIKGENDEVVTSFDAYGNATISGTLYANDIESERLNKIEELLKDVETNQALLTEATSWNTNTATDSADLATYYELHATNLFVTGQTAMTSLFISDLLTVNKIESLDMPLQIQSLAASPLEIMAGKIIIDTDGNTKFLGDVEIAGNLKINNIIVANNIDPIATESGSIIEGEINSNATAGKAVLSANTEKIRINNNKVSLNTLIYITPITSTQNKVLYVKAKDEDYFEVGFSDTLDSDVEFNWWIIELQ